MKFVKNAALMAVLLSGTFAAQASPVTWDTVRMEGLTYSTFMLDGVKQSAYAGAVVGTITGWGDLNREYYAFCTDPWTVAANTFRGTISPIQGEVANLLSFVYYGMRGVEDYASAQLAVWEIVVDVGQGLLLDFGSGSFVSGDSLVDGAKDILERGRLASVGAPKVQFWNVDPYDASKQSFGIATQVQAVPEPATSAITAMGLFALWISRRRSMARESGVEKKLLGGGGVRSSPLIHTNKNIGDFVLFVCVFLDIYEWVETQPFEGLATREAFIFFLAFFHFSIYFSQLFELSSILILSKYMIRILRYTFRNIVRNPLLSISSIFVIALLIFFVNVLLLVHFASERFIDSVNGRISFTISFQSGYTVQDPNVRGLAARLQDTFTGITIDPISKREALALMKERNPDLVSLIENTGENPLPESLRIDNIPLDQYDAFDAVISEQKDILFYDKDSMNKKLIDYKSQFNRALVVVALLQYVQYGVYALLSLFLFTVAVIIYTVIGNSIFFHRQEIEIIELVGGRSSFIYGPFLLQGAIYGFLATIVSGVFILFISRIMPIEFVAGPLTSLHTQIDAIFPKVLLIELAIFFFVGLLSALFALRRYVRI